MSYKIKVTKQLEEGQKYTMKFSNTVKYALRYYVYCLVDPRDKRIFYIGKGVGDRVFDHVYEAINGDAESMKLGTIRDIHKEGLQVEHYIIRHNLEEEEAYLLESTLIDFLTYPAFNMEKVLTNIVSGHHQWDEGIKTVEEIQALYDCVPIKTEERGTLLLVSLNQSFNQAKANGVYRRLNIYEATRKYWAIAKERPQTIRYILGVYKGVVRSVILVKSYSWTKVADDGTVFKRPRCCFEGQLLEESPYLNKDVSAYPFGSGGAIIYI